MADYTVTINDLQDAKRGDKWVGIPVIGPVTFNGETPDAPLARIRMHFVHADTGAVYKLDSDATAERDGIATVVDAETWVASIPEQQSFLPFAGLWSWDIELYKTGDAAPLTPYKGPITVNSDITR